MRADRVVALLIGTVLVAAPAWALPAPCQSGAGAQGALAGGCGDVWTPRTSGVTWELDRVVWTGTLLAAVGEGDEGAVLTSPDAVTWTSRASGLAADLYDICWTGTQLVAVGYPHAVITSPDGVTWTSRTSGVTDSLIAVCWTGTQLVAVGAAGAVVTSPDGVTWTSRTSGVTKDLMAVAWTGTQLVTAGLTGVVLTSPDGVTWTQRSPGTTFAQPLGAAASGSVMVVVGNSGPSGPGGTVITSTDGVTWTSRNPGTTSVLTGVTWTGSMFVAVGYQGTILTSPDGVAWTPHTSGVSSTLRGAAATGSLLVVVGYPGVVLTSPCGGPAYAYSTWVPVVSHNSGRLGSQWRSDLGLLNAGSTRANVQLTLYNGASPATNTTYVPAGSQAILTDVVSMLGASGSWSLEVRSDQPLKVTSRTYNQSATGTFGQDYLGSTTEQGLSAGQSAYVPHLVENASFRSNIGLANTGASAATVTVELHDGAGVLLTSYDVGLDPGQWKQETQPFLAKAGQSAMARGYAKVRVTAGSGVIAVASLIDNATSDPTTIPMQR